MKQQRDDKGKFTRNYRQSKRWEKIVVWSILIGITSAIAYDALAQDIVVETPEEEVIEIKKEVRIKVIYSEESIEELILEAFPDAPVMLRVARCESGLKQFAYNPTNNSHDRGIYQISRLYHGQSDDDMYDVKKNIAYAKKLFKRNGLRDWSASKHCWQ